jgi:lipid-A-disaccharide synthase
LTGRSLLVVAGEASGDQAAASVLDHLSDVSAFGLGGEALRSRGVDLTSDLRASTAFGFAGTAKKALGIRRAWKAVRTEAIRRRPHAALLVNYSEFNARLAPHLRAAGVRVLWYGAPQVWAWRGGRVASLAPHVDVMAVMLPFEHDLWHRAGIDTRYVGHPALEAHRLERGEARRALGLAQEAPAIALLPGSRPNEVRRMLPAMLEAFRRLRHDRANVDGRVLVAASLDEVTLSWLRDRCSIGRVSTVDVNPMGGATAVLGAFDAALCASGTASLEAALARAVPIVVYRVDIVTEAIARLLLRSPHVALPNVVLGRPAFPELLQRDAAPHHMVAALEQALDGREDLLAACAELEAAFGSVRAPSIAVANVLESWLKSPTSAP